MFKLSGTRNVFLAFFLVVAMAFAFAPAHAGSTQKELGGMAPVDALEYMKKTPNLFILDVRPEERHKEISFVGSTNIPLAVLQERLGEIPKDRPVMIHCRLGVTSLKAYPIVMEGRPDIPVLAFIEGEPPFEAYNTWKTEKMKKSQKK